MKKFKFHMEKLLSYKEQILDSEVMNLAILNNLLDSANKKRELLEGKGKRHKEEFQNKISEKISPADCRMYANYVKHIREQIELCTDEIEEIKCKIDKQAEKVKELKVETKSLETIKNVRLEEYQKENLKKQDTFIDEFVSRSRIVNQNMV